MEMETNEQSIYDPGRGDVMELTGVELQKYCCDASKISLSFIFGFLSKCFSMRNQMEFFSLITPICDNCSYMSQLSCLYEARNAFWDQSALVSIPAAYVQCTANQDHQKIYICASLEEVHWCPNQSFNRTVIFNALLHNRTLLLLLNDTANNDIVLTTLCLPLSMYDFKMWR